MALRREEARGWSAPSQLSSGRRTSVSPTFFQSSQGPRRSIVERRIRSGTSSAMTSGTRYAGSSRHRESKGRRCRVLLRAMRDQFRLEFPAVTAGRAYLEDGSRRVRECPRGLRGDPRRRVRFGPPFGQRSRGSPRRGGSRPSRGRATGTGHSRSYADRRARRVRLVVDDRC